MRVYADTSFLVSLYLTDIHSPEAERRLAEHLRLWLTPLHRAECAHAISQQVFQHRISATVADKVYQAFEADRRSAVWLEVPVPDAAFDLAVELGRRCGPRIGCRTLDTLHVASALELKADRFWTFDERQAKLADAEGLKSS